MKWLHSFDSVGWFPGVPPAYWRSCRKQLHFPGPAGGGPFKIDNFFFEIDWNISGTLLIDFRRFDVRCKHLSSVKEYSETKNWTKTKKRRPYHNWLSRDRGKEDKHFRTATHWWMSRMLLIANVRQLFCAKWQRDTHTALSLQLKCFSFSVLFLEISI